MYGHLKVMTKTDNFVLRFVGGEREDGDCCPQLQPRAREPTALAEGREVLRGE